MLRLPRHNRQPSPVSRTTESARRAAIIIRLPNRFALR